MRIVAAVILVVASAIGVTLVFGALLAGTASFAVRLAATLAAQTLPAGVVLVSAYAIDRREFADLGFGIDRDWWVDLGFGLGLGAALMTGVFVLAFGLGWVRVTGLFAVASLPIGFGPAVAVMTAFFAVSAVSEEMAARGYLLTNVAEGLSGYASRETAVGVGVVVSSLVFGAAHLANPNATPVSTLGISLAGVLLAAGYVLTGELAIPIGLHATWNLFQGPVFGFAVSGIGFGVSVLDTVETGPDVATGGAFGPEAGLLGVGAVLVGVAATVAYVRWRYGEVRVAPGISVPDLRWRRGGA